MWMRGYRVLTWGTSETRPRRLSSVSGTASTLGPICSCARWLVTKAQTTPILWDGAEEGTHWMSSGTWAWTHPPARAGHPSQQHEGGQQQEGHEGAALTGHLLVLRLHWAPTAPVATAATETEPGSGHHQEVEARDDSAHHVASLVPHHLQGRAARPF